jgi:hypothetical protein
MKTSVKKYRPQKPLNLGVLKYGHRRMYSGGGDMSQELNWSKACLSIFLSSSCVLRDEDAPFVLVYGRHFLMERAGSYQGICMCW